MKTVIPTKHTAKPSQPQLSTNKIVLQALSITTFTTKFLLQQKISHSPIIASNSPHHQKESRRNTSSHYEKYPLLCLCAHPWSSQRGERSTLMNQEHFYRIRKIMKQEQAKANNSSKLGTEQKRSNS